MSHRILLCVAIFSLAAGAYSAETPYDRPGENWNWGYGVEEGGGGSSYLGVDIADVDTERLSALKLKEEHGAEITTVDQDAPAGKAGLKVHDVILSLNGAAVESAAQLKRMIRARRHGHPGLGSDCTFLAAQRSDGRKHHAAIGGFLRSERWQWSPGAVGGERQPVGESRISCR